MTTIKDLALRAKVSVCTVSQVLNRHPKAEKIRAETRKRIFEAAAELGYRPNTAARNFRLKRSALVALVVDNIEHEFWNGLVQSITEGLGEEFNVLIANTNGDLKKEKKELENLLCRNVDAVILYQCASDEKHLEALAEQCPLLLLGRTDNPKLSYVKGDDYAAALHCAQLALADGHRKITFFNMSKWDDTITLRRNGIRDAVSKVKGARLQEIRLNGEVTDEIFLEKVFPKLRGEDLLICPEDWAAGYILKLLGKAGIRSPEDLSIIAWNDSFFLKYLTPQLSSIAIPLKEMGKCAAQMILRKLKGEKKVEKILLPEKLILRQSYQKKQKGRKK